jgi:zinc protease
MKSKFVMLTLTAFIALGALSQASKILPFPIQQKKLSNGLNVVTVPFNSPGLASLYIVVRAGSRNEVEEGKTGFAHFFEHMMFRGTPTYSPDAYNEVLKAVGASANANTSLDRTLYHMTGNALMLEKMFEVEGDRFQHLKYSEHDFKTEAGAVKGEYTKNSASPFSQLSEKIASTAFDKHTYKHTTMGFFKDVVDMPNQYQYSLTFFNRFYRPEYTTIIVVGDVKQADVNRYAEKYFGNWKPGNYNPVIERDPQQQGTRFAHIKMGGFPPFVSMNFKGPAFSDKDMDLPALSILMLSTFGQSSDIYQRLVVKEQKARSVFGSAGSSVDPNLISIGASVVKASDMQYIKDELWKTLEEAKTKPVDAKRLADTKSFLKYSFAMRQDSPDQIAGSIAQFVWLTGNPESINNYYSLFDKVTAQDIMNAAKKYFVTQTLTIGTIGPGDEGGVK